ncbi:sensor histidine kinase [Micromonospora halophytica]|uniref:histidine kinase n=1 Tax=Micromonospora halophytica TaxID=47864 RepID=A0A1C5H1Q1_9ACTN|nr:ATP-binding protein [Micromonospora halophytica]SCG39853.1 Histidine kinase-, DNA gyrase B-, and HSP90-like ATPase [Micromonospora halophytica]
MGRLAQWRRVARAHPAVADVLLAVVLFVASLLPLSPPGGPPRTSLTAGAVLLAALGCGALTLRRRHPLPVLAVATVTVVLAQFTGLARGPLVIAVAVAAYTLGTRSAAAAERSGTGKAPRRAEEPAVPTAPVPSLNRLDALVEGCGAGQSVRWTVSGQPRPLPTAVDVTAYRIIQESLTNAYRHAPGAAVAVRLRYDPDGVTVEVRDDGAPAAAQADAAATDGGARPAAATAAGIRSGAGLGVVGMRERVEAVGGTFAAGPRPDGGWLVRAQLPAPEELPDA